VEIIPLPNRVLCRVCPKDSKIVLLKTRKRRTETKIAEVMKCGDGVKSVEKGSKIVISGYSGRKLKKDNVEYLVIDESEIQAVVNV